MHGTRTMTFDQAPLITLLCSIWYVRPGADLTVKEAFTEKGVRLRALDVLELLLDELMII